MLGDGLIRGPWPANEASLDAGLGSGILPRHPAAVEVHDDSATVAAGELVQQSEELVLVVELVELNSGYLADQIVSVDQERHGRNLGELRKLGTVLVAAMLSSANMGSVRRSTWRQYIPFLILNVFVSAITILAVLAFWDRGVTVEPPTPTPTLPAVAVAASAVPTQTPTLRPSPTPHRYVVQQGDTMNAIALELGVSVEALMEANGLADPDTLSAGQVLLVPEGADVQSEPGSTSTRAPPSTAESGAEAPQVEIRGVSGAGDLENEVVRLLNTGGTAHMEGWTLEDGEGHVFTFPDFTLHNGAVSVHTRAGTNTVIDLYWGLPEPVWTPGKTITLRDEGGEVQSTFQIPGG